MATIGSDAKVSRYFMTWTEVYERLNRYIWQDMRVLAKSIEGGKITFYGIPRGGYFVAGMTLCAVDSPEQADFILDDIIDSGTTRDRWEEKYGKSVIALVDKQKRIEDKRLPWIVFPWETQDKETAGPEDAVVRILQFIGENPNREGLKDTPKRVIKAYGELCGGYAMNPEQILSAVFTEQYDELIALTGIRFTALCEHHLLPFTGEAAIGYIPNGKVVGISKLARLVDCFSRRLQIQERMTNEIAQSIYTILKPKGVAVFIKAHHECMGCRGVKQPSAQMITSSMLGVMRTNDAARAEFLRMV